MIHYSFLVCSPTSPYCRWRNHERIMTGKIHFPLVQEISVWFAQALLSLPSLLIPKHEAMKGPFWEECNAALFCHLHKFHSIETFGAPGLPPHDATLLPAVLVLKHVVNSAKQINDRKVRLCVNGSYQVKGVDYTESFAPTILAMSIKVFLAIGTYMHYNFYHLDISNAFQNTPAPPNAAGNRIWLKVFPEYMLWYQTRFWKCLLMYKGAKMVLENGENMLIKCSVDNWA